MDRSFRRGVATLQSGDAERSVEELPAADLVAGCDGVNSAPGRNVGAMWRLSSLAKLGFEVQYLGPRVYGGDIYIGII